MRYRQLGDTGLSVSRIGMGCWALAGGEYWGSQEERDSRAAVEAALEAGVRFFDTAEDYGDGASERVLGTALGSRRGEVVIATKASHKHLTRAGLREGCDASLRRLGTEWIDLYQVNWPGPEVNWREVMAGMEELKRQGKIRAVGVCNMGPQYLREALAAGPAVTNQLPYSLLWRAIESEILPFCREHGLGVLCYSPLAQGLLTGKFKTAGDVPRGRCDLRLFSAQRPGVSHGEQGAEEEAFAAIGRLEQAAWRLGKSMSQIALAWSLAQEGVTAAISGMRNAEQAKDNAAAADLELPADVIEELRQASEPVKRKIGRNADMWMHESRMDRPRAKAGA